MKAYIVCASCMLLLAVSPMRGQDSLTALAERQQWEERVTTMNARLEKLEEAIQAYQQRLAKLSEEIYAVREELARANNSSVNPATQKSLELLASAIKEVDRKRMADNEKVLAALSDIQKGILSRPSTARKTPSPAPTRTAGRDMLEYTVQAGDTSVAIAAKLKKNGVDVTPQQIIDANPGVNWNRLRIGAKLLVPAP